MATKDLFRHAKIYKIDLFQTFGQIAYLLGLFHSYLMKGLNELVTVLILVLMAVMFASVVWIFFLQTSTDAADISENITKQHQTQVGQKAKIENVLKNEVIVRNTGNSELRSEDVAFFVENKKIDAVITPAPLAPDQFGKFILNDSQLSMMPDPATLKITTLGQGDEKVVDFYKKYYVAHWTFDEGSGTTVSDSSINGNDGTCYGMGSVCNWTTGKYGYGIAFDGIDDNITVSGIPNPQVFTVEAWIKVNLNPLTADSIISKGNPVTDGYSLVVDTPNDPGFLIRGSSVSGPTVSGNEWHHVTGTFDGATMKLFVDGNFIGSSLASAPTSVSSLLIGDSVFFSNFNGTIDEVRILNISRPM